MDLKTPGSFSNGTTNAVRLYLRNMTTKYFDFTREETIEEITKIANNDPASKWLVHNLLFLHLSIEELESIKSDLTYFGLINLNWNPIDPELYVDLIFTCHLHEYFLQLIAVTRTFQFSRHLLSLVAERILTLASLPEDREPMPESDGGTFLEKQGNDHQEQLTKHEWLLYLSILSWLDRASDKSDQFFPHIHQKFLNRFLDLPESQQSTINKIEILIQLSGIVCLKSEDYQGNTEISDSLQELTFDPLISLLIETGAWQFFQEMIHTIIGKYGRNSWDVDIRDAPIKMSLVERMGDATMGLKFESESEICKILQGTQMRISRKMGKTLRHIGDYAYLTNLIIKKNIVGQSQSQQVCIDENEKEKHRNHLDVATKVFMITKFLEKFKSKSRCEDYDFRSMKFDDFCSLLRSRSTAKYRHVQQSWHDKFLSFDEAFTTLEGCSLAREYIAPKTSFEIGVKMLKKILKIQPSLTEEVKQIVLILIFNQNLYSDFDQIVDLIFKSKEVHEKLCTCEFQRQLNELNLKLGAKGCIDVKTDALTQSLIDDCRKVTIQNPLVAAQNILSRSLQLTKGGSQVLNSLRHFWFLSVPPNILTSGSDVSSSHNSKTENLNLFEHCLEQLILTVTDELTRNVHTKSQLKKFITIFLTEKFISKERFEDILLSTVLSLIGTQSAAKIVAVLEIYQDLISAVLALAIGTEKQTLKLNGKEKDSIVTDVDHFFQLVYSHMEGLREGTYFSTALDSNDFRDKTIEIINLLLDFNESLLLNSIPTTNENLNVLELPLTSLVLLYARVPAWRQIIQTYVKTSEFFEGGMFGIINGDGGYDLESFSIPLSTIEEVIRNSSQLEWNDVLDILYEIYFRLFDGNEVKAFEKWMKSVSKVPLFEILVKDETISEVMEGPKKKRRDAHEMKSPPLVFQKFGVHLVNVLTGTVTSSTTSSVLKKISPYHSQLSKYPALQLDLVKSFVAVACHFPDEPQYFSAKQWTLMSLLDLVTWIVKVNFSSISKNKGRKGHNEVASDDGRRDFLEQCLITVKTLKKTQQGKLEPIRTSIIHVLQVTQLQGKKKKIASIIPVEEPFEIGKKSEVELRLREMNEDAIRMNTNRECLPAETYCQMKILDPKSIEEPSIN